MRFTKGDYTVFSAGSVIIVVFSLLFYFDFTTRSAVGQERTVGSIIFKKHVAQRKYSSQVVWEDVEKKTPVYNNDSIRTSGLSEAVIRLNDGTEITVDENSMIVLSMAMDEIDIQFRGGSISAKRDAAGGDKLGTLNIRSGKSNVSMKNSDLQVSSGKEKEINVTVSRGLATVASGGEKKNLTQSQKAVITQGSEKIKTTEIALIPLSPRPDAIIITPEKTAAVQFSWGPLKAGLGGVLEVSAGGGFATSAAVKQLDGSTTDVSLAPGTYYWRMKAQGGTGGDMITGDVRKFTIIRESPVYQVFPADGQVFQSFGKNPVINFKWSVSDTAQIYRIDIASDPSMQRIHASYDSQGSSIAVDTLGTGKYYWQVTSIIAAGGETYRIKGKIRSLMVEKGGTILPPQPVFPPDGESINSAVVKGRGIVFSWDRMNDMRSFHLDVARSSDFREIVFNGDSKTNFLNFRSGLEPGRYYWRVTGILSGNRRTATSGTMRFIVTKGGKIKLLSPADKEELAPEPGTSVRFSWEKADVFGEYVLQIATDAGFSSMKKEARVNDSYAYIQGIKPGSYHWRVILKNTEGGIVLASEPLKFLVQDMLSEPVILSPKNGMVFNFKNINELDISWKKLKEANLYKIRFYRIENNRPVFIAERDIGNAPLEIDDINFLGEGKILWSIQAFDARDNGKRIVRKSRISRAYFEVRLPEEEKKIKFLSPKILYSE